MSGTKGLVANAPTWLKRLVLGASLGALANAAAQLGTFLFGLYLARALGIHGFGTWAIVYSTLLAAVTLSSLSINVSSARFASALTHRREPSSWGHLKVIILISSGLALTVSVALIVGADVLAREAIRAPETAPLLRWGTGYVIVASLGNAWSGIIAGREAYSRLFRNNLVGAVLLLAIGVPAVQAMGLLGGVAALALSTAVVLLLNRRDAHRLLPDLASVMRARDHVLPWRSVIELVGPAAISGLMTTLALWSCQVVLARSPSGTPAVGVFAAAIGLRSIALLALTFITSAALIILSAEQGRISGGEMRKLTVRINALVIVAAAAAAVGFALVGPFLIRLYGHHFAVAGPLIPILAASIFFEAAGSVFYNDLMLRRALVSNLWLAVLPREAIRLGLAILLIDRGALALGWSFLAASIVFAAITAAQSIVLLRREPRQS